MRFARRVFLGAGVWGLVVLTPMYFLFDEIGRQRSSPITYPQFYYGFLAVATAWQVAFLVIGSDPVRLRSMMIPSIAEKFLYCVTLVTLSLQGRIPAADLVVVAPDLVLGILFVMAFAKTAAAPWASASSTRTG
jgi:hypothetical protein